MMTGHNRRCRRFVTNLAVAVLFLSAANTKAEDGYRLWLRYDPLPKEMINAYRTRVTSVVVGGNSATLNAVRSELVGGCSGLLGSPIQTAATVQRDGAVVVGTPASSPLIAGLHWDRQLEKLGPEGFRVVSVKLSHHSVIVVASIGEIGALYGAFHLLRLIQTLKPISDLDTREKPRLQLRVLDHWDNLDGSIERGYAGRSLWDWQSLPGKVDPRLRDYARANASVGINGYDAQQR
jgi:alpha-glucuronidase